jgi:predicted flap endonuclease-1-like 5' DNA nuclease
MSAKSLLRKLKQLFGSSDRSGSDSGSRHASAEETDVTVEREPEQDSGIDNSTSTADDTETQDESGDSVEKIKGIGPTYRDRLEDGGLGTIPALASSDAETVADVAETSEGRAAEWIKRANNW